MLSNNVKMRKIMEKYIVRANETYLFKSFERPSISALLGSRRVGKTTLLENYMELHPEKKWVQLNMDILSQRNRVEHEELKLMIEQAVLGPIGGPHKLWVFIDEAQKCPQLFDQVKVIYDAYKGRDCIKFLLTGSAHLNLHKLTAESLAGRVELLHLREFNLKEMTCLLHQGVQVPSRDALDIIFGAGEVSALKEMFQQILPFQNILQTSLHHHLLWGGLPEVITASSDLLRLKYLGDYLQTYLEKDIRAIDSIGDLPLYQNLIKMCAEVTGSVRDDKKIIEALHCSRNTLSKYRNYLLATLQYVEIFPFIRSSIKRLVKSPKGYIINNGLISYLTGLHDLTLLKNTGLLGHRFENWFLNEIQTWLDTQTENHQIYFWRTAAGAEVDFVVTLGRRVVPFEITCAARVESKKLNNLKGFMEACPEASIGVVCYLGPLLFDQKTRILFLPAWLL
jgi:predicted AAA+ superfamily ATPase